MPNNTVELLAPFSGPVIPLNQVPDPVFSTQLKGEGLALEPLNGSLLAPCDGVISQLAKTQHALTITTSNGAQVLIHIGIDTVKLNGVGFHAKVQQGEQVKQGQVLIEVDLDSVSQQAPSLITMLVIANSDQYQLSQRANGLVTAGKSPFLHLCPQLNTVSNTEASSGPQHRASASILHAGGLHARPSALVQTAARPFSAQVQIHFKGQQANAKSMVALMTLGLAENDQVEVVAHGQDAEAACAAVVSALQTRSQGEHPSNTLAEAPPSQSPLANGLIGGVCAAPGLAIGQVVRLDAYEPKVPEHGTGVETELHALTQALQQVKNHITQTISDALRRGATAESDIFTAHLALLEDPELMEASLQSIQQGFSAGHAFRLSVRTQCDLLAKLGSALLAERISDLKDLERRVLQALLGEAHTLPTLTAASILVADDLAPSQLTSLPREQVAGFATVAGGATAHVVILARALGIPALVACGKSLLSLTAGQQVLLNASQGYCHPSPDAATLDSAEKTIQQQQKRREQMQAHANSVAMTQDGIRIEVAVNIATATDAREGLAQGADSVGLTRTEFLFIDRQTAPSTTEQQQAYQEVLDAMQGRPVIIRTLDVGGDKEVPYLPLPAETNPALGLRGIRSGFANPSVLDAQLTALLSIKPLSKLRILLPMICEVDELLRVRQRIEQLAKGLGLKERPQLGVMIEVPSAALLADQLAAYADFLSIGTNDLTQYTLAMDRCNATLAAQLDSMHPALLQLIAHTVAGARKHNKWVGVCGALASDPDAVPVLVGLGVTELSVSAALIPEIKSRVRSLNFKQCQKEAAAILKLPSAAQVREQVKQCWPLV